LDFFNAFRFHSCEELFFQFFFSFTVLLWTIMDPIVNC
jgi:sterol desaturase/sphingolipid hydroxylase (fatty acid hydroxylase superfamily)